MAVDDLSDVYAELREMKRMIRRLTVQNWLLNAAIGAGGIRVYDAGRIWFEGGGGIQIYDDGYLNLDGDFTGAGRMEWTGPWKYTGEGQITGPLKISGPVDITGNVKVTGTVTVDGAGRIKAGAITIDPTTDGGVITIGSTRIWVNGSQFEIQSGGRQIWNDGTGFCVGSRLGTYARFTGAAVQFVGIGSVLDVSAPAGSLRVVGGNVVTTRQV